MQPKEKKSKTSKFRAVMTRAKDSDKDKQPTKSVPPPSTASQAAANQATPNQAPPQPGTRRSRRAQPASLPEWSGKAI